MEIQNDGFNKYCLLQFGRIITKEELEFIVNQIIQDINKLHVLNFKIKEIAIEVIVKMLVAILKNEKIYIEKEAQKATIDVMKEIGKFKAKSKEKEKLVIVICEYIKMTIK